MRSVEESEGEHSTTEWGLDTDPEPESRAGETGKCASCSGPLWTANQEDASHLAMRETRGGAAQGPRAARSRKGEGEEASFPREKRFSERPAGMPVSSDPAASLRQRRSSPTEHLAAASRDAATRHSRSRPPSTSSSPAAGALLAFLLKPFRCVGLAPPAYGSSRPGGVETAAFGASVGVETGAGASAGTKGLTGISTGVSRANSVVHPTPAGQSSVQLEADKPLEKKLQTFRVRSLWTLILVFTFIIILAAGHVYSAGLVLALVASMYWEIIAVKQKREEARIPDFYWLKWYWFLITIMGFGLPSVLRMPWRPCDSPSSPFGGSGAGGAAGDVEESAHAARSVFGRAARRFLERLLTFHSLVTYTAGFIGLVWFILSLRKGSMRYQFSQLGVMLVALVFIVGQALMQIANIYSGLIWFILPTSLVIVNDVSAYICGMLFGRTRLIRLSPKKTVEGFVGASFITLLWAVLVAKQLQEYKVFVCPPRMIDFRPFAMWQGLDCDVPDAFVPRCYDAEVEAFLGLKSWTAPLEPTPEEIGRARLREDAAALGAEDVDGGDVPEQIGTAQERKVEGRGSGAQPRGRTRREAPTFGRQQGERAKGGFGGSGDVVPDENEGAVRIQQEQQAVTVADGFAPEDMPVERSHLARSPRRSTSPSCRFYFSPFQFHSIVLGLFAGFLAPFGGFFASGFKRAARIKDFGEIIPGHGGVTDRFDCQILTGMFTHLYYTSFVYTEDASKPEVHRRRLPRHASREDLRLQPPHEKVEDEFQDFEGDRVGVDSRRGYSMGGERHGEPVGAASQQNPQCLEPAGDASGSAGPDVRDKSSDWKAKTGAVRELEHKGAPAAFSVDGRDREKSVLAAVASMEDAEELERVKAVVIARLADLKRRTKQAQQVQEKTGSRGKR
ncbi:Phosphatidate cytidylyltransferase,related [Neospora caninum Liverpool]|uniref:Phosphatidate cytidylyltransferase n=1 Tax=Neospora caninum (strain Liverpool) TaxID=572307 RepID=F0VFT4_NEOCL|nr:Phosphatidate cytidylyltransferase,related [Neospora caninum Liverpool]CBZ52578.1 Phosphatidate cytidylyltransferase,related [Neospora caninum Liverpool]CEL66555.1 TPA: Phosphatidate cytidylyltransferase, related [Neospora caninum Liverpool]|eukprot:XP_003882610.1 Phosphatidate cytidylyltransferase,related [Neospora caninum Liverpool]